MFRLKRVLAPKEIAIIKTDNTNIENLTDHLFREESGKMVAVLTSIFGVSNLGLAEDVVQDTLLQALQVWRLKGLPENPRGWLYRVAKNKAIDVLRKNKHTTVIDFTENQRALLNSEYTIASKVENYWNEDLIEDKQLRMMYVCCNPGLNSESQITLILKTLCGFSTIEIAKAFLASEDTVSKRLYRAKKFFRDDKTRFEFPDKKELSGRTVMVLNAIYLLFNEGYNSSSAKNLIRKDLVQNALMLAKLMSDNELTCSAKGNALLALMCFHAAREESRIDAGGALVLLENQDRSLWSKELINLGVIYMEKAAGGQVLSSYHLEAAISYEHCISSRFEATNWQAILAYYDLLCQIDRSPVVALNRTVVFMKIHGSDAAFKELEEINKAGELDSYYLYHSLKGNIYRAQDKKGLARKAYQKAISLTNAETEKQELEKRILAL